MQNIRITSKEDIDSINFSNQVELRFEEESSLLYRAINSIKEFFSIEPINFASQRSGYFIWSIEEALREKGHNITQDKLPPGNSKFCIDYHLAVNVMPSKDDHSDNLLLVPLLEKDYSHDWDGNIKYTRTRNEKYKGSTIWDLQSNNCHLNSRLKRLNEMLNDASIARGQLEIDIIKAPPGEYVSYMSNDGSPHPNHTHLANFKAHKSASIQVDFSDKATAINLTIFPEAVDINDAKDEDFKMTADRAKAVVSDIFYSGRSCYYHMYKRTQP